MRLLKKSAAAACAVMMTASLLVGSAVMAEDSKAESVAASEAVSAAESAAEEAASGAEEAASGAEGAASGTEEAASGAEGAASGAKEAVSGAEEAASTAEETASEAESAAENAEAEELPRPEYNGLDFLTLGEYKNLTVEVDPIEITDAAIDSRITSDIRNSEAGSDTLTEGTVENGDVANINYEGKKDGVAFDGGTAEGYDLEIGSGTFIPGFEEGLIGVAIGDTVDLNLTFPESYGNKDLAGAETVFTVKVNSVRRYKELDDALAEVLSDGEAKTVNEYRARAKTMLEDEAIESRNESAKTQLISLAAANSTIEEYPQDLVDYTVNEVTEYYQSYAAMYGVDFNTFLSAMVGTTEEEFPAMAEEIAKESIKQEFTISAIAETEKLLPEGDELAAAYDQLAGEVGMEDGAALVAEYGEYAVKYKLMYDAVSDFLFEHATLEEREPAAESAAESAEETASESAAESAEETASESAVESAEESAAESAAESAEEPAAESAVESAEESASEEG